MPTSTITESGITESGLKNTIHLENALPAISLDQALQSFLDILLGPWATWVSCMYSSSWGERPLPPGCQDF